MSYLATACFRPVTRLWKGSGGSLPAPTPLPSGSGGPFLTILARRQRQWLEGGPGRATGPLAQGLRAGFSPESPGCIRKRRGLRKRRSIRVGGSPGSGKRSPAATRPRTPSGSPARKSGSGARTRRQQPPGEKTIIVRRHFSQKCASTINTRQKGLQNNCFPKLSKL